MEADKNRLLKMIKKKKLDLDAVATIIEGTLLDVNAVDSTGCNLLHHFIISGKPELVRLLFVDFEEKVNEKADPNILGVFNESTFKMPPLIMAVLTANDDEDMVEIVRILIENNADFDIEDSEGCSFLHRCVEKGSLELIRLCLRKNPDIDLNKPSKTGAPIFFAISRNHELVIELLLEKDIDLRVVEPASNLNPLGYALKLKETRLFQMLIEKCQSQLEQTDYLKAIFANKDKEGNTLLHLANLNKFSMVVKNLLKFPEEIRVDPKAKNNKGFDYEEILAYQLKQEAEEKKKESELRAAERLKRKQEKQNDRQRKEDFERAQKAAELRAQKADEWTKNIENHRCKIASIAFAVLIVGLALVLQFKIESKRDGAF